MLACHEKSERRRLSDFVVVKDKEYREVNDKTKDRLTKTTFRPFVSW